MRFYCIILALFVFSACDGRYRGKFIAGSCVQESNKKYVQTSRKMASVYKIHKAKKREFTVSVWFNNSWMYQGKKPNYYFDEGKNFFYELVECPDGSNDRGTGISQRIKKIEI